ncbi:dipeptidase [Halomonadaceae bacterium KBTZ08]
MRIKLGFVVSLTIIAVAVAGTTAVVPGFVERSQNRTAPHSPHTVTPAAAQHHARLTIADWHADSLLWNRDLLARSERGHVDIPRLRSGNVAVQVFTAVTKSPAGQNYESNTGGYDRITPLTMVQLWPPRTWFDLTERALYQAERLHGFAERAPGDLSIVTDAQSLETALERRRRHNGELVIGLLGIEGLHALEGELSRLDELWEAGYRVFGLHHFFDNALGGSLHGINKGGLTAFGREVVRAIDARGGIIDVVHSSPAVVADVLDLVDGPVVLSHTGMQGACNSPRNISDDLMRRIAANGGVIGIGYWEGAVCGSRPEDVVATIRYAIDLLGADHVALGSDYDGAVKVGFDASKLAVLTDTMRSQGFTREVIRKVMGGNTLRFLHANLPRAGD